MNKNAATSPSVTDEQIEALMTEAGQAGDGLQVAVCLVALGKVLDERISDHRRGLERIGIIPEHIDADVRARAACARAIADANA